MLSGFIAHRRSCFWSKSAETRPEKPVHSGKLQLVSASKADCSRYYHLTQSTFYQCQTADPASPCELEVPIFWTELFPFQEVKDGRDRFGFSLIHGGWKEDFLVENESELIEWLDFLERKCILSDVKDDFVFVKEIGRGGQSRVFLGHSTGTGELVAIKQFSKSRFLTHPRRVEALVNEVEALRRLDHPRVLKLHRVYEDSKSVCLVTEYIQGVTLLQSLCTTGQFSLSETDEFVINFLELLAYLSAQGVLHRDFKPENIMIPNGTGKRDFRLIDFGFATTWTGQTISDSCGSIGYMAPELLVNHEHDNTVDIYSAGIIVFILVAGYSPFYATSREKVQKLNVKNEVSFDSRWDAVHERYKRLISSMVNTDPRLRKSALQLKAEFLYQTEEPASINFSERLVSVSEE